MSAIFNPLDYPIIFTPSLRSPGDSAWREHIPFAKFIIDILKPNSVVELGTYAGASYCAFCQAVHYLRLPASCWAVDTWQGEAHAGVFGDLGAVILKDLKAHHDPIYGSFSRLLQSTFDDALSEFNDGTVDLLHIDGFHSYEAVKHDYDTWLPKMSPRGVILFHDIAVTKPGFGVKKFWEETKAKYPHFEFHHGHGLGVLAVGREQPHAFTDFIGMSSDDANKIRLFFSQYGAGLSALGDWHLAEQRLVETRQQLDAVLNSKSWRLVRKLQSIRHLAAPQKEPQSITM